MSCDICFSLSDPAKYRAVLKYPTRVVKVVLIGVKCLSNVGLRRFFSEEPWELEKI